MSEFICTKCGSIGIPQTTAKGSLGIEIILWLFFLIPGLIYSLWRIFSKYSACPQCGSPSMIPTATPAGQKLVKEFGHENQTKEYVVPIDGGGPNIWVALLFLGLLSILFFTIFKH